MVAKENGIWVIVATNTIYDAPPRAFIWWDFKKPSLDVIITVLCTTMDNEAGVIAAANIYQEQAVLFRETYYQLSNLQPGRIQVPE